MIRSVQHTWTQHPSTPPGSPLVLFSQLRRHEHFNWLTNQFTVGIAEQLQGNSATWKVNAGRGCRHDSFIIWVPPLPAHTSSPCRFARWMMPSYRWRNGRGRGWYGVCGRCGASDSVGRRMVGAQQPAAPLTLSVPKIAVGSTSIKTDNGNALQQQGHAATN